MESTTPQSSDLKVIDPNDPFFVEEQLSHFPAPNLQDTIPAFLHKENWKNYSGGPILLPDHAMRLIWKIIQQNWPIWHAILLGPVDLVSPLAQGESGTVKFNQLQYGEPLPKLTKKQTVETAHKFMEIADKLQICVRDLSDRFADGTTEWTREKLEFSPGYAAKITIGKRHFDQIRLASETGNTFLLTLHSLTLCNTFLHELAHVVAGARSDSSSDMCHSLERPDFSVGCAHLGDSCTDEIGFEVENRIWGGIFSTMEMERDNIYTVGCGKTADSTHIPLGMRDWPNHPHTAGYVSMNMIDIRGKINPVHCVWHVSAHWISNLFQEDFWSTVDPNDSTALRMPKDLGFPSHASSAYPGAFSLARAVPEGFTWTSQLNIRRMKGSMSNEDTLDKMGATEGLIALAAGREDGFPLT